ncbi:MAG: hypothetical protein R3228_09245 [Halioglobus sp.]|nr:hypothetical protein [Halioglobus sp.]
MSDSTDEMAIRALIARYCDGVYDDNDTRATGHWMIQSRRYQKLYGEPTDAREAHFPYPGAG